MCPCPFCSGVLLLLAPLLLFKKPRAWLKAKIKKHHGQCETCQKAEHAAHLRECGCTSCAGASHLKVSSRADKISHPIGEKGVARRTPSGRSKAETSGKKARKGRLPK